MVDDLLLDKKPGNDRPREGGKFVPTERSAYEMLGLDEAYVDRAALYTYKKEDNVTGKVTKLKNIAVDYKMTLEGKQYDENKGGYVQITQAIAGKHFIDLSYGIMIAFANDANLLTSKDIDKFNVQFVDACRKMFNLSLRDRSIKDRDQRAIIKMFKDTMLNVGDIITGSAGNMARVFSGIREMKEIDSGFNM